VCSPPPPPPPPLISSLLIDTNIYTVPDPGEREERERMRERWSRRKESNKEGHWQIKEYRKCVK